MTAAEAAPDQRSQAQRLADAGLLEEFISTLDEAEAETLLFDWEFWRRPAQAMPPENYRAWLIRAGRGFGKTRTGAETCRHLTCVAQTHGRLGLIAPTSADCRDVLVEGESGILATSPPSQRPHYEPSKRRLTWPNGAIATLYSGEEPDRLRGPQHDAVWMDEPASMPYGGETLANARLGLRLGRPFLMVTGTPKPKPWLRELADEPGTYVTSGSTYDNRQNLAPEFISVVLGRFEGTRLGRQELYGEFLDDVEGALWTLEVIEAGRIIGFNRENAWRSLRNHLWEKKEAAESWSPQRRWRTIVAVDPPGETAECGIVVGCAPVNGRAGVDHAVILADESLSGRPEKWGQAVVAAWQRWGAEAVYVEKNQGGDMVRSTIQAVDPACPVKKINARESKQARAEPVAALYERGLVHHAGFFGTLEEQLTTWIPDESKSPDRLDAAVHCVRELLTVQSVAPARVGSAVGRSLPPRRR